MFGDGNVEIWEKGYRVSRPCLDDVSTGSTEFKSRGPRERTSPAEYINLLLVAAPPDGYLGKPDFV